MFCYEDLVSQFSSDLNIVEVPLEGDAKGYCIHKTILIDPSLSEKEKIETILEEWGHHKTSTGNILDLRKTENVQQENRAMDYAIEHYLPLEVLETAIDNASIDKNNYEIAENLNITTAMLTEAYEYHIRKETLKKPINSNTIVTRIIELANDKNISISELENLIDVEENSIYKWDRSIPPAHKVQKIAKLLDVSLEYLILGTNDTLKYGVSKELKEQIDTEIENHKE